MKEPSPIYPTSSFRAGPKIGYPVGAGPLRSSNPSFGEPRRMDPSLGSSSDDLRASSDTLDLRASWSSQGSITPAIPKRASSRRSSVGSQNVVPRRSSVGSQNVAPRRSSVGSQRVVTPPRQRTQSNFLISQKSISSKKSTTHKKQPLQKVAQTTAVKTVSKPTVHAEVDTYYTPCHERAVQIRATRYA
jgi:hypothetical protein